MKELKAENRRLKRICSELSIENDELNQFISNEP